MCVCVCECVCECVCGGVVEEEEGEVKRGYRISGFGNYDDMMMSEI